MVNLNCRKSAYENLMEKKEKLKSRGVKTTFENLKMSKYLLPESKLNQEEMRMALEIRTDMCDIPSCRPYKYEGSKMCRNGCPQEEDLLHAIKCQMEINEEVKITNENLESILKDNLTHVHKKVIQNIMITLKSKTNTYNDKSKSKSRITPVIVTKVETINEVLHINNKRKVYNNDHNSNEDSFTKHCTLKPTTSKKFKVS